MSSAFNPNRRPPPRRRSRPITLTLLGAAVLSSCVCCLVPAPQAAPDANEGGGDFGPDAATPSSARGTATSGKSENVAANQQAYRRSYVPFWLPLFFPRSGYSGPRGPNVRPAPAPSPNVSRNGFGRSGGFFGGGG